MPPNQQRLWYQGRLAKARNYLWKSVNEGGFRRIC